MAITIDNPSGGDCGFYAFSIGLIEIIQTENKQTKGNSPTFNRWLQNGLKNTSLNEILEIDLETLSNAPGSYKTSLLNTLQMSVRHISAEAIKDDLYEKIKYEQSTKDHGTVIEGSSVYVYFMELVNEYSKPNPSKAAIIKMSTFNELALSPEVKQLAIATSQELTQKLKKVKDFATRQKIENNYVKEVVVNNVTNPSSVILKAVDLIKEKGRWANHCNLKEAGSKLEVNLNVLNEYNGAEIHARPTIFLINNDNIHWTTQVDDSAFVKTKTVKNNSQGSSVRQVKTSDAAGGFLKSKESYQENIAALIAIRGFFSQKIKPSERIDINRMDQAKGIKGETIESQIELDHDFAIKLQEAEFRAAGYKI